MQTILIAGINSDIGTALGKRYLRDGWNVVGTYRTHKAELDCKQYEIDLSESCEFWSKYLPRDEYDRYLSCVGDPSPLGPYLDYSDSWDRSFEINGPAQLRLFREVSDLRKKNAGVCFLSAGGVNSCPTNFSAYTLGKVFLVKACELIAAEEPDLNIFTYGPGWVNTKTHDLMINMLEDGPRKTQIEDFRKSNNSFEEDINEIYKDLEILYSAPKEATSGRNFARKDQCLDPRYQSYWHLFEAKNRLLGDSAYKLRIQK